MLSTRLLTLPIFQGISKSDLTDIMGYTHFEFNKYPHGKTIVKAGDRCERLLFLMKGVVECITTSSDQGYTIHEYISAPYQLQTERLFGLTQYYSVTFRAHTECHTMSIVKPEVVKIYNNYEVVRINLLNAFSARIQRMEERLWVSNRQSLRDRILRFFVSHCLYPAGEKTIYMKMNTLAAEMSDSRLNVSIELNRFASEGLIELSRGRIHIPAIEKMFMN